jgi:hypothetical protein
MKEGVPMAETIAKSRLGLDFAAPNAGISAQVPAGGHFAFGAPPPS